MIIYLPGVFLFQIALSTAKNGPSVGQWMRLELLYLDPPSPENLC